MAKRQVNKNLVAFLTAAGIVLAVIVVAIGTVNRARRDPAAIAEKAAAQEQAGNLRRALALYRRAYRKSEGGSEGAKYLINAARCAREMGELGEMFGALRNARAQSPDDPEVLNALLMRYWEIRSYPFLIAWDDIRECAERLLHPELEPDNLLALVWKSAALEQLKEEDPANAVQADNVLRQAVEIDPTSPFVALVRAERTWTRALEQARRVFRDGRQADAQRLLEEARAEQVEFLRPAVAEHPDEVPLRIALVQALVETQQWEASRTTLEAGLAQQPQDAELHYAMASLLLRQARRQYQDVGEDEVLALVNEGLQHINGAIELERALYAAYSLRADLQRLGWMKDGRWASDFGACQKDLLEPLKAALRDTVGLRTFRAALGGGARMLLIRQAFDAARSFYQRAPDEAVRSQAETYLRVFLQEGKTRYPEHALASSMEGYVALIDGNDRLAVKKFSETEKRDGTGLFSRPAREELIRLYRKLGELGVSLDYTVKLIESYEEGQLVPPSWLYWNQAEVLLELDREQEALDLLDSIATRFADDPAWKDVRARALALLGRGAEGARLLQEAPPDDPRSLFLRAGIAEYEKDYDTAETLFRQLLELQPEDPLPIRRLIGVMVSAGRSEDALRFVRERIGKTENGRLKRLLQTYEVTLSITDPQERNQKLLEIIAGIPDDFARANQYFSFWLAQDDLERAAKHLDQMESLREGDVNVLRMQLDMALRLENCERAAAYTTRLSQLNADQVGGATFRGLCELACGDPQKALSEFRAAEREFPSDSKLKINVARAMLLMQPPRYDRAIQTLEQAVELDPRNFLAHRWLYHCYDQTGRREQGIPHLEAAAEQAAKLRLKDSYIEAHARLLDEEKNPQQGIQDREQLRAQNPEDVGNLLRLAELYGRIGDEARAEERLWAAFQVDPSNLQVAGFGANFFARRGNRDAGEQLLYRHMAALEGLEEIYARVLLGRFYRILGDPDGALAAYQQAQERVGELFAAGSEERRRGMVLSASELAQFYRQTQRFQDMIDAYRVVLNHLDAADIAGVQTARRSIISGLMSLRQYGDAAGEIADYRRDFPDDPGGLAEEAKLLMARRRLDRARDALSRVLELQPENAWALYMRSLIYIEQGRDRYPAAYEDLLRAKAIAPRAFNLKHRLDLARLCALMEKPELAETELRELLPLPRATREVELRLINLLGTTDQFAKAQEFVNELMTREPDQPFWPYQLGRLLMARGEASSRAAGRLTAQGEPAAAAAERREAQGEYSAAAGPLQKAVALTEGQNPVYIADWMLALARGNRAGEATQSYERLRGENPQALTPLVQTCAAEAYLVQKQRDQAVALLEEALHASSLQGISDVRLVADRVLRLLGWGEGLVMLRRVLDHAADPNAQLALRSTLARYLASAEDPAQRAEGLKMTDAVLAAAPKGGLLHLETLLVRAIALEREGQREQVAQLYEECLRLAPDNPQALNNLAYLLADKLDRAGEALPYAQRLQDLAPDNPNILDTVGWVYFKNGNIEQAEAVFLEALRIDPGNVPARYHLGRVYADSGEKAVAERALRRALELAREQQNEQYEKKAEEALGKLR
ncbi:MAG: tetratricopeptide repeat protein [Phycisphaerae bacterium]